MAQGLKKSLPKRCSNDRLKGRRAASWARTQERKKQRQAAGKAAASINQLARARGEPTAHEIKQATRAAARQGLEPQPRTSAGNIMVDVTVQDEHGTITIKGIKPCCNGKSYFKCNHNPKAPFEGRMATKGRFYMDLTLNTRIPIR